jgi:hypothetical protein
MIEKTHISCRSAFFFVPLHGFLYNAEICQNGRRVAFGKEFVGIIENKNT